MVPVGTTFRIATANHPPVMALRPANALAATVVDVGDALGDEEVDGVAAGLKDDGIEELCDVCFGKAREAGNASSSSSSDSFEG